MVRNSVVMTGAIVSKNAVVDGCILAPDSFIDEGLEFIAEPNKPMLISGKKVK